MAAYDLETFVDNNYETSPVSRKFKSAITLIIDYWIISFIDNIYVVDYNKRALLLKRAFIFCRKKKMRICA
jgi:hypothetical protein